MENRKTTKSSKSSKSESGSNCFIDFFKNILNDKKKLIILISIIVVVIILIIVIAVVVSKKKNNNNCGVSEEVYQKALKELEKHNEYRKQHQVGELTINCDLMKIAQKYSEKLQKEKKFQHSHDTYNGNPMGENLHWTSLYEYTPPKATDNWYNEIEDYNFNTGKTKNGKQVGHFTQVVWKGTKELGIGVSCGDNGCYVVGNYYPAGNYIGQYTENVLQK